MSPAEKKCYFGKLSGDEIFHDDNLKNNGAIVIPWLSTIYG